MAARNSTTRPDDSLLLTLSSLLQSLLGAQVQVELRDDAIITGVLEEADGYMNISLSRARIQRHPGARVLEQELLYVKGTSVRFVHLPEEAQEAEKLMRNRLKLVDQGASAFSRRIKKPVPPPPAMEALAPLVSEFVTRTDTCD
ncbi:hypothetical protein AB1Y20_004483 [Prymnesium parvum]|uniref:Sm domain-containing protein n=1 Tax=Prymnesium parvum TaxID=97485 RepID=A0AB34IZ73_PRYPA